VPALAAFATLHERLRPVVQPRSEVHRYRN
jgi:hypothetical protein